MAHIRDSINQRSFPSCFLSCFGAVGLFMSDAWKKYEKRVNDNKRQQPFFPFFRESERRRACARTHLELKKHDENLVTRLFPQKEKLFHFLSTPHFSLFSVPLTALRSRDIFMPFRLSVTLTNKKILLLRLRAFSLFRTKKIFCHRKWFLKKFHIIICLCVKIAICSFLVHGSRALRQTCNCFNWISLLSFAARLWVSTVTENSECRCTEECV